MEEILAKLLVADNSVIQQVCINYFLLFNCEILVYEEREREIHTTGNNDVNTCSSGICP